MLVKGYAPLQAKFLPKLNLVAVMVDQGKGWEAVITFTPEQALDFGPKLYNLAKTHMDNKTHEQAIAAEAQQPAAH